MGRWRPGSPFRETETSTGLWSSTPAGSVMWETPGEKSSSRHPDPNGRINDEIVNQQWPGTRLTLVGPH